jgi:rare lipoprotein A
MTVFLQRGLAILILLQLIACSNSAKKPSQIDPGKIPATQPMPRAEPLSAVGNHSPYRVNGRTYRVLPTAQGYLEEGIASWYGPNFHGRLTSNQETFDMHQFTAAHRSLPLPSYAKVTNLGNSRSVVVRINDRGPFKGDRLIDLSFAAAKALDMIEEGTARVRVSVLEAAPGTPNREAVRSAPGIYLQLGAFSSRANAITLLKRLRQSQIPDVHIYAVSPSEGQFVHRVRIGPLNDVQTADELVARLTLLGLERPRVVFE